jgi:hypothetical protein
VEKERGSRVVIKTELRPKGLLALLSPVMRRTMHGREDQNLGRVRAIFGGHEVRIAVPARAILQAPEPQAEREVVVATNREDMRRAWDRINSFPTQRLDTRFGFDHVESDSLSASRIQVFRIGSRESNRTLERLE